MPRTASTTKVCFNCNIQAHGTKFVNSEHRIQSDEGDREFFFTKSVDFSTSSDIFLQVGNKTSNISNHDNHLLLPTRAFSLKDKFMDIDDVIQTRCVV